MEFFYKILNWLLGIGVLIIGWTIVLSVGQLKILLFDKTLTKEEKKEIKKGLRLLYIVPVLIIAFFIFLPIQRFYLSVGALFFVCLFAFIILSKKNDRKSKTKKDGSEEIIEAADFLKEGKEMGEDLSKGIHDHF